MAATLPSLSSGRLLAALPVVLALALCAMPRAFAADPDAAYAQHHLQLPDAAGRSSANYPMPRVQLIRADGKRVWLADELNDGRPVVLDFVYTTCTSVCPLSSQTFAALQDKLGVAREHVHLVSISIDPEQDTPDRLQAYARHFEAGPQWQFYTGTAQASLLVQQAFGAYSGDKMSHPPLTLLRVAPGKPWVRFDGFATVSQLLHELQDQVAAR
jgi:protein SCO1/2